MKFLFIDETSDSNKKDYFGICAVLFDAHSYEPIKKGAQKIINDSGWDSKFEFKGTTLFSATLGDTNINIEKRIKIAKDILSLSLTKKHQKLEVFMDISTPIILPETTVNSCLVY